MSREMVLILDFGGRSDSQLVARNIRKTNVYCEVKSYKTSFDKIKELSPKGIVVTCGENLDLSKNLKIDSKIFEMNVPVIGIGDKEKIESLLSDKTIEINSINDDVLEKFVKDQCKCKCDWTMEAFAKSMIEEIKEQVGDKKVLLALSGGVDSSVVSALISKAVGKNLTAIFVNHGLLRKYEVEEVTNAFDGKFELNFVYVDASQRFYKKLEGVTEPERKRKIIGEEFIRVFEEESKKIGAVDFFAQGTIYPDIIESGTDENEVIKSHHNVGGLPDYVDFKEIIEPLKYLFKDEVRQLGLVLGLPKELVHRQPFPGPGLGVRIVGEITEEKVKILQNADYIYREEIKNAGLDTEISQYFAALTNVKSVGAKNHKRTYDYAVMLRAVSTIDFMTAEAYEIPYPVLKKVMTRITREVEGVNRVFYDLTSKPVGTIELE